jgi:hypothetical protein
MPAPALRTLIEEYPSHSFVIDYREAEKLFKSVRRPHPAETRLFDYIQKEHVKTFGGDFLRDYSQNDLLIKICFSLSDERSEGSNEDDHQKADAGEGIGDSDISSSEERTRSNQEDSGQLHACAKPERAIH